MWAKLIVFAALGVAIWLVFLRSRGRAGKEVAKRARQALDPRSRRRAAAAEMTPCPICGAYREKGEICDCDRSPTP